MSRRISKPSLEDYEESLSGMVQQLQLLYRYNGGDEGPRTVAFLLKQIHKRTTWLGRLYRALKQYDKDDLLAPIEQVFAKTVLTGGEDGGEKEKG